MKLYFAAVLLLVTAAARADIVLRTDKTAVEGKILEQSPAELVIQSPGALPIRIPAKQVSRILPTDDRGSLIHATARPPRQLPFPPPEPSAPPLALINPTGATYYRIPLQGEVGVTILASVLEKSLADAALRQPTVVILDINSPGGSVDEATHILKVLHTWNPKLRIIAFTDRDLSAAAIISMSVREIYVRPSSTIGAAVSFVPTQLILPPKLEEKFQSAWRAVARTSAEEGNHEPLLADAMIDNSVDLHIESVDNKPVVKPGPERPGTADAPLLRKGKILTLTAREAVACGLATGEAEDLDDLAKQLHLAPWSECKGLAGPLADYIPQRAALFKTEFDKIGADLSADLAKAEQSDPTRSFHFSINTSTKSASAATPSHAAAPAAPEDPISERLHWKQKSLACVIALQSAEQDLQDAIDLSTSFGLRSNINSLSSALAQLAQVRATIFDLRNRYGEGSAAAPTAPPAHGAPSHPGASLPVTTVPEAEAALASPGEDDQSRAARFLSTAPIDPAEHDKIQNLLLPYLQGPDSIKSYIYMEAFAHWANKDDARVLAAILAAPAASPNNPNPQNRYWPAAITALVRVNPAAAEPLLHQRKSEFYFRSKITFALQSLIDANDPAKPAAQHLLQLLH